MHSQLGDRLFSYVVVATVATVLAGGACPAGAQSQAPIVIDRSLMTPVEIAETGLAPEVQVRATIDVRGSVSKVEVLSVTPSTEFDSVVIEATQKLIGGWHYAPGRDASDKPVEATLQWTLSYGEIDLDSTARSFASNSPLAAARLDPQLRHFTKAEQSEILERYSATAERFIDKTKRKTISSPRFIVTTDSETEGIARALAINLEATFNFLDDLFGRALELMPEGHKTVVYFYANKKSYLSLASSLNVGSSAGFYYHPGLLAFHQEVRSSQDLLHTMLHEATHAYLLRYLLEPGVNPGMWFSEGLAEYVGNSTINRKGEIVVGKSLPGRYVIDYHGRGAYWRKTNTGWTLDKTKTAIRTGDAPSLGELFLTPRALFTGERGPLNYGMAWLFLHFLRHGDVAKRGSKGEDGEWAQEHFPRFLLYVVEGYPPIDAIEQIYRMPLEQMNDRFKEYVKRF